MSGHVLDDWIGAALRADHRRFAFAGEGVVRYRPEVAPFGAVAGDLAALDAMPYDDVALARALHDHAARPGHRRGVRSQD